MKSPAQVCSGLERGGPSQQRAPFDVAPSTEYLLCYSLLDLVRVPLFLFLLYHLSFFAHPRHLTIIHRPHPWEFPTYLLRTNRSNPPPLLSCVRPLISCTVPLLSLSRPCQTGFLVRVWAARQLQGAFVGGNGKKNGTSIRQVTSLYGAVPFFWWCFCCFSRCAPPHHCCSRPPSLTFDAPLSALLQLVSPSPHHHFLSFHLLLFLLSLQT